MKLVKRQVTKSTIRFSAKLVREEFVTLPGEASEAFPSVGAAMIEGTINGFPFRIALESSGKGNHRLKVNQAMRNAAGASAGDTVTIEILRVADEPETRIPTDLKKALTAVPSARALWSAITPMARQNWILWISSAKQTETRRNRIEKACDMLASGKRRVCCFGGLNWLRKDHPTAGETWLRLPK